MPPDLTIPAMAAPLVRLLVRLKFGILDGLTTIFADSDPRAGQCSGDFEHGIRS